MTSIEQNKEQPLRVQHEEAERRAQEREEGAHRLRLLRDEDYDASGDARGYNLFKSEIWLFVLFCAVTTVLVVSWGFHASMKEKEIVRREKFLTTLKYRYLYIKAELIEHERFSTVQRKAQDFGLGLELSSAPPFEVFVSKQED